MSDKTTTCGCSSSDLGFYAEMAQGGPERVWLYSLSAERRGRLVLPTFLVIGAQRAGSTWLYRALRQHPAVYMPEKKEVEFFSYTSGPKAFGLETYERDFFSQVPPGKIAGEASPSYFWAADEPQDWNTKPPGFEPDVPGRVRATLGPDARLVLSLRDPVERAASAFMHHVRMGRLDLRTSILDAGRQAGIVGMGFYGAHFGRWLQAFPRESFWVCRFDQLRAEPGSTYESLCTFLGLDPAFQPELLEKRANRGIVWRWEDGDIVVAGDQADINGRSLPAGVAVSRAEVDQLRRLYAPDLAVAAKLTGIDVSSWSP